MTNRRLPDPVLEVLDDRVEAARVQRIWAGVSSRRRSVPKPVLPWAIAAAALALCAFLLLRADSPPKRETSETQALQRSASQSRREALSKLETPKAARGAAASQLANGSDLVRAPEESEPVVSPTPETALPEAQRPAVVPMVASKAKEPRRSAADAAKALLDQADDLRAQGRPEQAARALSRLISDYPADPNAALAAFTLGRIALDDLDDPARAVSAFRSALRFGAPSAIEEDLRARLVEAHARTHDSAATSKAAAAYLARFPNGRRKGDVEAWSRQP